jgi:methyltransferase
MEISLLLYGVFLLAIGAGRLIELRLSRKHQQAMLARGIKRAPDPAFRWIVALHSTVLAGSFLEVWLFKRPFIPLLAVPMLVLFALANMLRWWVIATMAEHWNVQVMDSLSLGVVTRGPFRYIRHPNYLAVFVELLTVPLIHSAYLTAILGSLAHLLILRSRIVHEEAVLMDDPGYRAAMASKPRFIPVLKLGAKK